MDTRLVGKRGQAPDSLCPQKQRAAQLHPSALSHPSASSFPLAQPPSPSVARCWCTHRGLGPENEKGV